MCCTHAFDILLPAPALFCISFWLIVDCLPRCASTKRSIELERSLEKPGEYNTRNLLALRGKDMHVSISASAVFVKHEDRDFQQRPDTKLNPNLSLIAKCIRRNNTVINFH